MFGCVKCTLQKGGYLDIAILKLHLLCVTFVDIFDVSKNNTLKIHICKTYVIVVF